MKVLIKSLLLAAVVLGSHFGGLRAGGSYDWNRCGTRGDEYLFNKLSDGSGYSFEHHGILDESGDLKERILNVGDGLCISDFESIDSKFLAVRVKQGFNKELQRNFRNAKGKAEKYFKSADYDGVSGKLEAVGVAAAGLSALFASKLVGAVINRVPGKKKPLGYDSACTFHKQRRDALYVISHAAGSVLNECTRIMRPVENVAEGTQDYSFSAYMMGEQSDSYEKARRYLHQADMLGYYVRALLTTYDNILKADPPTDLFDENRGVPLWDKPSSGQHRKARNLIIKAADECLNIAIRALRVMIDKLERGANIVGGKLADHRGWVTGQRKEARRAKKAKEAKEKQRKKEAEAAQEAERLRLANERRDRELAQARAHEAALQNQIHQQELALAAAQAALREQQRQTQNLGARSEQAEARLAATQEQLATTQQGQAVLREGLQEQREINARLAAQFEALQRMIMEQQIHSEDVDSAGYSSGVETDDADAVSQGAGSSRTIASSFVMVGDE